MATLTGTVTSVKQLLQVIATFATDPTKFPGGREWKLKSPAVITSTTDEVILMGIGDGQDEIYVGMKIEVQGSQENILLNGYAGYDPFLEWFEQPGSLYEVEKDNKYPCLALPSDARLSYWLTANTQRITVHVEASNQYHCAYLGFFDPISVERQYPYPMLIGGDTVQGQLWNDTRETHSAYFAPKIIDGGYSSMIIRRPDGVWEYGGENLQIWPTDHSIEDTFVVYDKDVDSSSSAVDHMLFPMMIYEKKPTGIFGKLDGVYWIGNRADLASKDSVIYRGKTYKVFDNVNKRGDQDYHVVEWA